MTSNVVPTSKGRSIVVLSSIHSGRLVVVPVRFTKVDSSCVGRGFRFPTFSPCKGSFTFSPVPNATQVLRLPFVVRANRGCASMASTPFGLLLYGYIGKTLRHATIR